jgi:two-component system, chemotaxis family, chemotaxis protein CheY
MKTCLVVDDSRLMRQMARFILEEMDFRIIEAENGQQAMETCKQSLPDAVLLDWNMPVMDGIEFLYNLRRLPHGDEPKVILCSTENDISHISRAFDAGANEYVMKPLDKGVVTEKLQVVGLI